MNQKSFEQLYSELKKMRLPGMAAELKRQYEQRDIMAVSGDERIEKLIRAESETRGTRKIQRLINNAAFRYPEAQIDTQLVIEQGGDLGVLEKLLEYEWIGTGANLLIIGPTGSGKSYIACGSGIGAAAHNKTVRYERSGEFLRLLSRAESNDELTEVLKKYSKYDLLILDDFGLMRLDINICRNLFELLDSRDGRGVGRLQVN